MTTVAVLGGGAGGRSAVVELVSAGHEVRLWNRNRTTITDLIDGDALTYRGVLGDGTMRPAAVGVDLERALAGADVAVVCLPSMTHAQLFDDLARLGSQVPIVLNPGHTGGALQARECWRRAGRPAPPLAELSTLTYVARVSEDRVVTTTGRAGTVRAACLPGGEDALGLALALFPGTSSVSTVIASSLSNVNLVLHPPGALLGLAWVEATGGDFRFYVEAVTPAVARVMTALDDERRAVAAALNAPIPPLLDEMAAIGTVEASSVAEGDLLAAVRSGAANQQIRAPSSINERYYREDLPFGLLPLTALAEVAGVEVPVAEALLGLATVAIPDLLSDGRDASALGIDRVTRDELIASVTA